MDHVPAEFFTVQSMLTLTGATGATYVICNGLQHAFNFNPRWLALAIALAISMFGTYLNASRASDYFVGIVNGFLIYCTAVGATQVTAPRADRGTPMGADHRGVVASGKRRFRSPWF